MKVSRVTYENNVLTCYQQHLFCRTGNINLGCHSSLRPMSSVNFKKWSIKKLVMNILQLQTVHNTTSPFMAYMHLKITTSYKTRTGYLPIVINTFKLLSNFMFIALLCYSNGACVYTIIAGFLYSVNEN